MSILTLFSKAPQRRSSSLLRRLALTSAAGTLLLCSCAKKPQTIADNSCPVISRTSTSDQAAVLKVLADQGMTAADAGAASDKYSALVTGAGYIGELVAMREKICSAVITNDQKQLADWQKTAADVQDMMARRAAHQAEMASVKAQIDTSAAYTCQVNRDFCRR